MDQYPAITTAPSSKFVVMVLLGDYLMPHGDAIWLKDLLELLALNGVVERTARSTISRMGKEGWFSLEKEGRESRIRLSQYGKKILSGGTLRQNEAIPQVWDGVWHTIAYSLPEEKRKGRNRLRKQLSWLGYGAITPGLWISPHDRRAELGQILDALNISGHVHILSSRYWGPLTEPEIVCQCWDLPVLESLYTDFVDEFQPRLEQVKSQLEIRDSFTEEDGIKHRFALTTQFFPILQQDPNLPLPLLPADWVGIKARTLFNAYRQLVTPMADQYIKRII